MQLIFDMKRGAVLRTRLSPIIEAGRGDVGVPEPFLHLGNVRLVGERIRCRCRPH